MVSASQRRKEIVNLLFAAKEPISMEYLARKYEVHPYTIRRDIDRITPDYNVVINRGRNGGVIINSSSNKGKFTADEYDYLIETYSKMSDDDKYKKLLFNMIDRLGPS